jgi:hypothetical protein
VPTDQYAVYHLDGWTVRVNKHLLSDQSDLGNRAMHLLDAKLYEITRVVPPSACAKLQRVPIWLGVNDGHAPCSEYHPSQDWLSQNGYNPDKAKSVEIGNASRFLEWTVEQPAMVLHELSHAYHDQILGFNNPDIINAYHNALQSGAYNKVLRCNGSIERAYALTDEKEYFAESCEAFFGTNDFYPFVKAELQKSDPQMYALLTQVWNQ